MKFLCVECDERMDFSDREQPGDGTFAAAFSCPKCGHRVAMLANPMETQLVESLGVQIGGRTLDTQPLELIRKRVQGDDGAFLEGEDGAVRADRVRPQWDVEAQERLARVPRFVRGMVKKIYVEWAVEQGIEEITPAVMDKARIELGLEGM